MNKLLAAIVVIALGSTNARCRITQAVTMTPEPGARGATEALADAMIAGAADHRAIKAGERGNAATIGITSAPAPLSASTDGPGDDPGRIVAICYWPGDGGEGCHTGPTWPSTAV